MKKYFLLSLITTLFVSSAAMAIVDREDEWLEKLDLKGARVAIQAIQNGFYVNWKQFDFKNTEDDERPTNVAHYLEAVLGSKSTKWYEKSVKTRYETGDYQHPLCLQYSMKGNEYYTMQSTLSDSWSRAFSDTLGPQDEMADEGTSSSLASISESSHESITPSTSSMSTSPKVDLEKLDEKATKAVLRAITHKFEAEWEKFDLTDSNHRQSAEKVSKYLDGVLEGKQSAPSVDPQKFEKYSKMRAALHKS
jgi:hypothetical protein